ncbi:tyrosine-type recombinase/integrase [Nocardia vulneris]|uniref:tyrosine-type recombinase/integrase n=1 Tax=Nocardia vulneris TaxID=1141657 RepID=UPI0030D4FB19
MSDKLVGRLADAQRGIPVADKSWTVVEYLDYYLGEVAPKRLRLSTIHGYDTVARLHIKPMMGTQSLTQLTVTGLQQMVDRALSTGMTISTAIAVKTVLGSALTCAMREDLVVRNVARLIQLPAHDRDDTKPWSVVEIAHFLKSTVNERLYAAYLIVALYGVRRGEAVGLRWADINWDRNILHIRQQLVAVRGTLFQSPLKTKRSKRDLPLLTPVRDALDCYRKKYAATRTNPPDDWDVVFRNDDGKAMRPQSLTNFFERRAAKAGLRHVRLHDLRHSTATLLKDFNVPDKDIQLILGHSRVSTTQDLYEHENVDAQRRGLTQLEHALLHGNERSRQTLPSKQNFDVTSTTFQSVAVTNFGGSVSNMSQVLRIAADPTLTPIIYHLRARLNTHFFGLLAVNLAVKMTVKSDEPNLVLWQWIPLYDALGPQPRRFVDRLSVAVKSLPPGVAYEENHRAQG